MTRKRFVKLLMGVGYDRNGANLFATIVNDTYWFYSYQDTNTKQFDKHNLKMFVI